MTPLASFYPYFLHMVPSCSTISADRALVDAAIEFCQRTMALRSVVSQTLTSATTALVPSSSDEDVLAVIEAQIDGETITPISATAGFLFDTTDTSAIKYYTRNGATLSFFPATATSGTLRSWVAFAPKRGAAQIDDRFAGDWLDTLVHGTLARIFSTPGQAYSDLTAAEINRVRFSQGCAHAAVQEDRGNTEVPLRITLNDI